MQNKQQNLLPYPVIYNAIIENEEEAQKEILSHFSRYIHSKSVRYKQDKDGITRAYIDKDVRSILEAKLIMSLHKFLL